MKIFVLSKQEFDGLMMSKGITNQNVESISKTFFISINDTFETVESPYFVNRKNVKVLFFDDTEIESETRDSKVEAPGTAKPFTIEQARELFKYIISHKDKENCMVHCTAGISRSGAVGLFISDYFGGDWNEFIARNPNIQPNKLVFRLLQNVAAELNISNGR